jgi:hypothetical protein
MDLQPDERVVYIDSLGRENQARVRRVITGADHSAPELDLHYWTLDGTCGLRMVEVRRVPHQDRGGGATPPCWRRAGAGATTPVERQGR